MGRLSRRVLVVAAIAAVTAAANAQTRNVLLEQHTGAWCGWCPDGTAMMDEILALYGNQVIGVKVHNGDAMEIPEESVIGDALGLLGFPTAAVNRAMYRNAIFLGRADWKAACAAQMQQRAKAGVDCFYLLDKASRAVTIQVVANVAAAMDFPLKFNAFIVEDDVTGTGSGYDQHNYLSGQAAYRNSPYYSQPAVIAGYHHMKVVRKMLGGAWGVPGALPASVKPGESYVHVFQSQIDASWNIDKVWFVGMLQADALNSKEIINCALAVKDDVILDTNAPAMRVLTSGSSLVNEYALQNTTNQPQTYTVTLSTTTRTPADWAAQFAGGATALTASGLQPATGQMVVGANATAAFSLALQSGSTPGVGDAQVTLTLPGTPAITRSRIMSGVSREIKHLLLEAGSDYSLRPYLANTTCADAVTLTPNDYLTFAQELVNVKVAIWNKGPSDGLSPAEVATIRSVPNVNTFLCGDYVVASMSAPDLSYFGVQWIGWNLEDQGTTDSVWLSGQPGDVITGTLGSNIEGRLIYYYLDMVKIADTRQVQVFPILHFQNDGLKQLGSAVAPIAANSAIVGIRSMRNNGRTVLLSLTPYVIVKEQTRQTLVKNIVDWLAQ